ncbi:MAG: methyltransferase domain-containing protein [Verrucomicrobiales bacterium]
MKFPFVSRKRLQKAIDSREVAVDKLKKRVDELKEDRVALRAKAKAERVNLKRDKCVRKIIASVLTGEGIEIGALHFPLSVSEGTVVKYVDYSTREENIAKFPELDADAIVTTDYVCNGEKLEVIEDETQDFVIANHMLEHCINPLGTLQNFLRVVKPGGHIFISLPDKRFTFDVKRPITPFSHIKDDFEISREVEDLSTYEDWVKYVSANKTPSNLHKIQQNIHFHAWTQAEILEMYIEARKQLGFPLEIEWAAKNGGEFIVLLRKDASLTPEYF